MATTNKRKRDSTTDLLALLSGIPAANAALTRPDLNIGNQSYSANYPNAFGQSDLISASNSLPSAPPTLGTEGDGPDAPRTNFFEKLLGGLGVLNNEYNSPNSQKRDLDLGSSSPIRDYPISALPGQLNEDIGKRYGNFLNIGNNEGIPRNFPSNFGQSDIVSASNSLPSAPPVLSIDPADGQSAPRTDFFERLFGRAGLIDNEYNTPQSIRPEVTSVAQNATQDNISRPELQLGQAYAAQGNNPVNALESMLNASIPGLQQSQAAEQTPVQEQQPSGGIESLLARYIPQTSSDQVKRILQLPEERQGILGALVPGNERQAYNLANGIPNPQMSAMAFNGGSQSQEPFSQGFPQQAVPQQQQQGVLSRIGDWARNNDFGNRLTDWGIGLSMGSTPQESLSLGAQNLYQGNIGRQQADQERQAQEQAQQQQMQTAEWVKGLGYDDAQAGLIMSDPKLFNSVLTNRLTPQQRDSLEDVKREKYLSDIEKTRADTARAQSQGGVASNLPAPPAGYRYQYDVNTGEPNLVAIAGGPAAQKQEQDRLADDKNRQAAVDRYNIVKNSANDARAIIERSPRSVGSVVGQALSKIPGTSAADLSSTVSTLKASASFDQLQRMREASKTGAALGSVSDVEIKLLSDATGSLDLNQSKEQFLKNLNRVQALFASVVDGKAVKVRAPDGSVYEMQAKYVPDAINNGGEIVD